MSKSQIQTIPGYLNNCAINGRTNSVSLTLLTEFLLEFLNQKHYQNGIKNSQTNKKK